jgi:serine/threonine protein kinase
MPVRRVFWPLAEAPRVLTAAQVVDFGLSQEFVQGSMLKTCCGSPTYCAPEMTQGKPYDGAHY